MPKTPYCKHCLKEGHYQTFCPSKPRKPIEKSQSLGENRKSLKRAVIKSVSDKQKQRLVKYHKLRLEHLNAHPKCEANLEGCRETANQIHHLKGRVGDNLFNHFMSCCGVCHTIIEAMGEKVYEQGLKLKRNDSIK